MNAPTRPGPRPLTDPYPEVLAEALRRLTAGEVEDARAALRTIRFEPEPRRRERWPATSVIARVYARDRYQCRYCGERTILPPVMRLLSRLFPDEFPMHSNWKADLTHPAFVSRSTTLDHVTPIAGGGDPVAETNLVTACWGCNRRKGDLTLVELSWTLRDPVDQEWRGLTELYEPAWIAAGRPQLSETEMTWMRATRLSVGCGADSRTACGPLAARDVDTTSPTAEPRGAPIDHRADSPRLGSLAIVTGAVKP